MSSDQRTKPYLLQHRRSDLIWAMVDWSQGVQNAWPASLQALLRAIVATLLLTLLPEGEALSKGELIARQSAFRWLQIAYSNLLAPTALQLVLLRKSSNLNIDLPFSIKSPFA